MIIYSKIRESISHINLKIFLIIFLISILALLFRALRFYVIFLSLELNVGIPEIFFMIFMINFAVLIPISVGGLGIQEAILLIIAPILATNHAIMLTTGIINRIAVYIASVSGLVLYIINLKKNPMQTLSFRPKRKE